MSESQTTEDSQSESESEAPKRRARSSRNSPPLPNLPPVPDIPQNDLGPVPNIPLPNIPLPNIPAQGNLPPVPNLPPLPNIPVPQNAPQNVAPQNVRPVNDTNEQRLNRRWSVWAKGVFHLPDGKGQNQILSSAIATCARIDETTLQPGKAAALTGTPHQQNDPLFAAFVVELGKYEALPLPREEPQSKALLAAAKAAKPGAVNDPVALAAIDETLSALKAFELRFKITKAGTPPWQGKDASDATAAKVELDMLSLGPNRTLRVQGGGVNPSFWVERSANDGAPDKKSFLCKPPGAVVSGIPPGGEIAREALTGRAASALKGAMKLDLDMPETHVISMPEAAFPQPPNGAVNGEVACSVQEAKNVTGDFESTAPGDRDKIPASQCAATVFLDLVTLNTDRHVGNIMVGNDGGLVPIDHGCTFPSNDNDGRQRIRNLMGGPHNALLQLPGSHEQMTEEMAAGLRGLDPKAMRDQLEQSAGQVEQEHPAMAGLMDAGSLDASLASTRFLKLSGDVESGKKDKKVRLSPAAVQVAFAANADELLAFPPPKDDKVAKPFDKRAKEILKQALADQPIMTQVCLMPDPAYARMQAKLEALDWYVARRVDGPTDGIGGDPALCAKLLSGNFANPLKGAKPRVPNFGPDQLVAARKLVAKAKPQKVMNALGDCELDALLEIAAALPAQRKNALTKLVNGGRQALLADTGTRRKLMREIEGEVRTALDTDWAAFQNSYTLKANSFGFKLRDIRDGMRRGDFVTAKAAIDYLWDQALQGNTSITPKNQAPQNPPQNNAPQGNAQNDDSQEDETEEDDTNV